MRIAGYLAFVLLDLALLSLPLLLSARAQSGPIGVQIEGSGRYGYWLLSANAKTNLPIIYPIGNGKTASCAAEVVYLPTTNHPWGYHTCCATTNAAMKLLTNH